MKGLLIYISVSLYVLSCAKAPSLNMTNAYIEVIRPGDRFGLTELDVLKLDSTFGYPVDEKEIVGYTLVDRKTHEMLSPNGSAKVYFNAKNAKFCWRVRPDIFSAKVLYVDTINIKTQTWYRVSSERYHFDLYFFIDEKNGTYIRKLKPFPGAY